MFSGSATFVAYIDESGDEGFSFGRGSSEWFVLSSAITRKANDLETVKLVDIVRGRLGKPDKKPLHFRDLKHKHRLPFVDEIAKADLGIVSTLVHKPSLREPEEFQDRYRLYFYSARYLIERISWYCRDHWTNHDAGDGTAEIVFSNRSGVAYEELKDYLRRLEQRADRFDAGIDWSVIRPDQVTAYTAGKRMGLQIADAIASSFFYAVQPSRYGYTEDRYARMLEPVVYHKDGHHRGYGLQFWPGEVDVVLQSDARFEWLRSQYK